MMYSLVNEAYNDKYKDKEESYNYKPKDPYINTQGEYLDKNYLNEGTQIKDLKKLEREENLDFEDREDDLISVMSSISNNSLSSLNNNSLNNNNLNNISKKLNHKFCIDKFVNSIICEDDLHSRFSSKSTNFTKSTSCNSHEDDMLDLDIYNHVKACKFCRYKINNKLKLYYNNAFQELQNNQDTQKVQDNQNIFKNMSSNNVILLLVIAIICILILDMFVKIIKT